MRRTFLLGVVSLGAVLPVSPNGMAGPKQDGAACPLPTVRDESGACILEGDAEIDASLDLASFTRLDCRGYRISPRANAAGVTPQVGIFLREHQGIRIENCVIAGFDFGIYALASKASAEVRANAGVLARRRNRIAGNVIDARVIGVALMQVDNTEVKDNAITYRTRLGRGVQVGHDSDLNVIKDNDISSFVTSTTGVVTRAPGPVTTIPNGTNPVLPQTTGPGIYGQGILIAEVEGGEPTLMNIVVGGDLYQLATFSPSPSEACPADNLVQGNRLTSAGPLREGGILLRGCSLRTTVRGNNTTNMHGAIVMGVQYGGSRLFPGTCSGDEDRLCLTDADCMIEAVDHGVSKGTCPELAPRTLTLAWLPVDTLVEGNDVRGPIHVGIEDSGVGSIVRDNTIVGPSLPDALPSMAAGMFLRGSTLETSRVTGNRVSGVRRALRLDKAFNQSNAARFFGARITRNDFVGELVSVFHVVFSSPYDLDTELSALGHGNYWGRTCADSDGFRDFDEPDPNGRTDAPSMLVTDSHPYGEPVAQLPESSLPPTCK